MKCRKFRVEGRVQGVWFRESTRQQAERLNIRGYAVNLPDGSVEVLACGKPDTLAALAEWLQTGPRLARVDRVLSERYDGPEPDGFSTA